MTRLLALTHAIDATLPSMPDPALDHLARRYMWWADPAEARDQRDLLLAQLMQLGTWDDVQRARELFGDDAFRQALRKAPAGVLDARSWNYWHLFYGIEPVPPLPERPLP